MTDDLDGLAHIVKPLEWSREDDGSWTAESPFGLYAVYFEKGYGWLAIIDGSDDSWVRYPSEDFGFEADHTAKTAAETDYTRRILSALTPDAIDALRRAPDVGEVITVDDIQQAISDVFSEGGSVRDAAVYVKACVDRALAQDKAEGE